MQKLILLLIVFNLYAAPGQPDAGSILQEQRVPLKVQKLTEQDLLKPEKLKERKEPKASDISVVVKEFILDGNITIFSKDDIQKALKPYIGKKLNVGQLYGALNLIDDMYKKNGNVVVKIFFPKQDITDGLIIIKVIEGKIDDSEDSISISGKDLRINQEYVIKIVKNIVEPGSVLNKKNLERAILIISDMPGIKAATTLKKGTRKDSTKVILETTEGNLYNPYVTFDNTGSGYTGYYKGVVAIDIKDISGYGDEFQAKYTSSSGAGDLQFLSLAYSSSVLYSGLRAGVKTDILSYELGKEFKSLNLEGSSSNYSVYLTYPICRSTQTNITTKLSYDASNLEDKASGVTTSKKSLDVISASVLANHSDQVLTGGYSYGEITYVRGNNNIKDLTTYTIDQAATGARTDGDFQKVSFNASRIQRGSDKMFIVGSLSGQYSFSNLDSSQKFQLGGAYGVRAYPSGEGSGDHALKATLEARYNLTTSRIGTVKLIGFYDWGRVQQYKNAYSIPLSTPLAYNLSGCGTGLNFSKANDFDGSLAIAMKIGSNPGANATTGNDSDGTKFNSRVWFTLRKFF